MDNITKNQKQQLKNLPPLLSKYQQANIFEECENVEFSKLYNNDNMESFSRNYLPSKNLSIFYSSSLMMLYPYMISQPSQPPQQLQLQQLPQQLQQQQLP